MGPIFEKTDEQQRRAEEFAARLEALCEALAPYSDVVDVGRVRAMRRGFLRRTEDFFRENRRFTMAVVGRVKAGKSTFLNTLLFGGRTVLPRALTPKTALLTRMEYAREAALTVRFLTRAQWEDLCRLAGAGLDTPQAEAARETVAHARRSGTPLEDCFAAGTRRIPLEECGELDALLDDYVGEGGRFAPAVDGLTLGLPLDCLREITVVDTPGLNDPVVSRTEQTRRCLETCDAVFFLSRCGSFLDRSDLALLTAQLPQKGTAELILAASQFDSALIDALPGYSGLEDAAEALRRDLAGHAEKSVGAALRELRVAGVPETVLAAVERCRRPIFLSALAEDLSHRPPLERSERDRLLLRLLGDPGQRALERIGNFTEARAAFAGVAAGKDELLRRKAQGLVSAARGELRLLLGRMRTEVLGERDRLRERLPALKERQRELSARLVRVRGDVDEAFAEYLAPLEETVYSAFSRLERLEGEWAEPERREGLENRPRLYTESAAQLLRPWTWGQRRTVYTNEQTSYGYLDPADARRNLEQLSLLAERTRAAAFLPFLDTARLQNRLTKAAADNFPPQGASLQPGRLQAALDGALSRLGPGGRAAGVPLPDVPAFGGEPVRDPAGQAALREACREGARRVVEECRRRVERDARRLREQAAGAAEAFSAALCGELSREREALAGQSVELERECGRLQELAELLERSEST